MLVGHQPAHCADGVACRTTPPALGGVCLPPWAQAPKFIQQKYGSHERGDKHYLATRLRELRSAAARTRHEEMLRALNSTASQQLFASLVADGLHVSAIGLDFSSSPWNGVPLMANTSVSRALALFGIFSRSTGAEVGRWGRGAEVQMWHLDTPCRVPYKPCSPPHAPVSFRLESTGGHGVSSALQSTGFALVSDFGLDTAALARQVDRLLASNATSSAKKYGRQVPPRETHGRLPVLEPLLHNSHLAAAIREYLGGGKVRYEGANIARIDVSKLSPDNYAATMCDCAVR